MTNSKRTASLDEVLADYAHASQEFDAKVLQAFVDKFPDHARALQRYAQVQLTFVPATREEIDNEPLSDEDMLPAQSRLLQRMRELRGSPSAADATEAAKKLAAVSGDAATQAAAMAVFGTCAHGEDLLLLSVTDAPSDITGVPMELTRFRGHLTVKTEGVRNAHHQAAVSGGVPTTDHRARPGREVTRRARA